MNCSTIKIELGTSKPLEPVYVRLSTIWHLSHPGNFGGGDFISVKFCDLGINSLSVE